MRKDAGLELTDRIASDASPTRTARAYAERIRTEMLASRSLGAVGSRSRSALRAVEAAST